MKVEYYNLVILYEDKEVDILVSNAGGYFNFEIFKKALMAANSLLPKEAVDALKSLRK